MDLSQEWDIRDGHLTQATGGIAVIFAFCKCFTTLLLKTGFFNVNCSLKSLETLPLNS